MLGDVDVTAVHGTGIVPGSDARVGMAKPMRSHHDAMRVSNPGGVSSPEIMRGDAGQTGRVDRLDEAATEAVIALLSVGCVS
jgi:hypothetical protein